MKTLTAGSRTRWVLVYFASVVLFFTAGCQTKTVESSAPVHPANNAVLSAPLEVASADKNIGFGEPAMMPARMLESV